jgi:hypothetical protein
VSIESPTPDEIRKALDVLKLDPEWVRTWGDSHASTEQRRDASERILTTLLAPVRALDSPPVPVTRDTPAGTVIRLGKHQSVYVAPHPIERLWFVRTTSTNDAITSTYADGWVEVSRPEPEPTCATCCDTGMTSYSGRAEDGPDPCPDCPGGER